MSRLRRCYPAAVLLLLLVTSACGEVGVVSSSGPAQPGPTQTQLPTATTTEADRSTPTQASLPTTTPTSWVPPTALAGTPIPGAQATLTAAPALKKEVLVLTNSRGEKFNMSAEVADTPATQELGLMYRSDLPPDAGMLFDFGGDTTEGFWMANTILPLSIAFIKADGTIQDVFDMQALDRNTTSASGPYHYALETNQGYFRVHNLQAGDHVLVPSAQGLVLPGMPSCAGEGANP